jgi:hypothetical protein
VGQCSESPEEDDATAGGNNVDGHHRKPDAMPRGEITSKEVVDAFAERMGVRLHRTLAGIPGFSEPHDILRADDERDERFGTFRIDVYRDRAHAVEGIQSMELGENGVYWAVIPAEHRGDRTEWLVSKQYENVVSAWWNTRKRLDRRWHELDRVLMEIVASLQ